MSFSIMSKYRNHFMGLAVILILIFHLSVSLTGTMDALKNCCDFGVNIFFVISGFSMCYAWEKNPHTLDFLKRRISRIALSFLPVVLAWCVPQFLIGRISLIELLLKVTTLKFWIDGNLLYWYISGILFCYLITPFWIKLYKKNTKLTIVISIFISISLVLLARMGMLSYIRCFTERVPVYFLGLLLGYASKKNLQISKKFIFLNITLVTIGIMIMTYIKWDVFNYNNKYLVYLLWTMPFLFLMAAVFEKIQLFIPFGWLIFMGSISLEVYLLHERLLFVITIIFNKIGLQFDEYQFTTNIIVIMVTILAASIYQKMINVISKRILH